MTQTRRTDDTPQALMDRGTTILIELIRLGVNPLHNREDLLLMSLIPLAIKKILTGETHPDLQLLQHLVDKLDLTALQQLIEGIEGN